MTLPVAYADPVDLIIAWINGNTTLVGAGKPLNGGVDEDRRRSPARGAYAHATWIATTRDTSDAPIIYAVVSFAVYGMNKTNARKAAIALARVLDAADGEPIRVGDTVMLCVESITGPSYLIDGDEHRFLVDASIAIEPA